MTSDPYKLIERRPSVADYNRVRGGAGLAVKDPIAAEAGLAHSLYAVCVLHEGECVGIGRVIGDGGLNFDVVDVAVLPAHQGKGLGKRVMDALMGYIRANARPTAFVSLMTTEKWTGFYASYGFKLREPRNPGMAFIVERGGDDQ